MTRLLALFFCLFPLLAIAAPQVAVKSWQEETNLTDTGKTSEILMQAKAVNLPANQAINSFSLSVDPRRNIKLIRVISDGKAAEYTFKDNSLVVKFAQPKKNLDPISIYFSYEEKYEKIFKYLRQEIIDIPAFARGADARVVIRFPGFMESATLNPNVIKAGHGFIYSNTVPEKGVQEILKLTNSQNIWDAIIKVKVTSNNPLGTTKVTMPVYFKNGGQKIENAVTSSSISAQQQSTINDKQTLKFNTPQKEITIENKARIITGASNRTSIVRNPKDYTKFTPEEATLLTPFLDTIKSSKLYSKLPLHAKIGKFVNEYIKYDISYVGKLPKVNEILRNPIGVCTEYAKLYDAMARVAGIPSLIVNGVACGEYNDCRGHAWNLIYHEGKWVDVDPTWDLMSGIVSSSHVYFSDESKEDVEVEYFNDKSTINSQVDFEIKSAL